MITSTSIWSEHAFSTVMSALSRNRLTFNFNEEALNVKEQSGDQLVGPSILPNNNTSYNLKKSGLSLLKMTMLTRTIRTFQENSFAKAEESPKLGSEGL